MDVQNVLEINKPLVELPNTAPFCYSIVRIEMNRTFNHSIISIIRTLPTGETQRKEMNKMPFKISRKSNYTEYQRGFALVTPDSRYFIEITNFKKGDVVKLFFNRKSIQLNK